MYTYIYIYIHIPAHALAPSSPASFHLASSSVNLQKGSARNSAAIPASPILLYSTFK